MNILSASNPRMARLLAIITITTADKVPSYKYIILTIRNRFRWTPVRNNPHAA